MRLVLFILLFVAFCFSKPLVVYTGVYSVRGDKDLGKIDTFVPMFYEIFAKWQNNSALPFDIMFETDAEATKHLASDPISMAILLTRNDFEVEHFKNIGVTKTVANLGFSVLFYQTRKSENGSVNTILASVPLNSYMTNEKKLTTDNLEAERPQMIKILAKELIQNRFKQRVSKISIEEMKVKISCTETSCFAENYKKLGLEDGQSISISLPDGSDDVFLNAKDGSLIGEEPTLSMLKKNGQSEGVSCNLRGYSEDTWQVVSVDITSKKASKLFAKEPIKAQFAQWYSDFLSGAGKAVLPPISGVEWSQNSMGHTEMVLARADGEIQTFSMAPARYKVSLGISGVGSGVVEKNQVNEIWAYKIWLTRKWNNRKEEEVEYTTSKKVVVASQEVHEVDIFRDLLHVSSKKFAEKGE
ncbi:hypothetical protein [Fibrobacter sp.]|uniref:hypothetical protein n=1 Tax=Fibrobacter sp. TaxID=35828 RepID=UPI0025C66E99|nr:hypothetical protein [Fibrobacter sp.]MBR2090554.1 hypothetical protein [Fibrobacter sp.]MBR3073540.1 hypothetical protein [Fibrobacter sp.]